MAIAAAVPCNAWCRPTEGLHALLACSRVSAAESQIMVGRRGEIADVAGFAPVCLKAGTRHVCLAIDEAVEHSHLAPAGYPFFILATVQVAT